MIGKMIVNACRKEELWARRAAHLKRASWPAIFNFSLRRSDDKSPSYNRMDETKTVSVRVSDDELRSLSRTRRKRRTAAALRTDKELPPVADVQKVVEEPLAVPAPAAPAAAAAAAVVVAAKPHIVFTKKNHGTAAKTATPGDVKPTKKPVLVVQRKKESEKDVGKPTDKTKDKLVGKESTKEQDASKGRKKTRRFKARRLSVTLNARTGAARNAAKRVAAMSITDVRAQLVAAGLLKGKTRSPPAVLRDTLKEWIELRNGA